MRRAALLLSLGATATVHGQPAAGPSGEALARQIVQESGEVAAARKCGWATPVALTAAEGSLDIMRADLITKAPADAKTRFEADIGAAKTQGASQDCTVIGGNRAAIERKISAYFDQMLVQTDYFSRPDTMPIIALPQADAREVELAVSWFQAALPTDKFTAFVQPLYGRARTIAQILCTDLDARGKALDNHDCGDAAGADKAYLPAAQTAARHYLALARQLATEQRRVRVRLEANTGPLANFYKPGPRPSDCRVGDTVYDYGTAPKRSASQAGLPPVELTLVRRITLGKPAPNADTAILHLRQADPFDGSLPSNPEGLTLTALPSDGPLDARQARFAVAGRYDYAPDEITRLKAQGMTDAQLPAQQVRAAQMLFDNFVSKALMVGGKSVKLWRCPSGG